jgi:cbb3-type cytochrome oxidase maturation protein
MSVLIILIGCSFLLAVGFLIAFIWSVKSGQMDDDYTPSVRILFDDFADNSNKESEELASSTKRTHKI